MINYFIKLLDDAYKDVPNTHHRIQQYSIDPTRISSKERFDDIRELFFKINDETLHGYFIVDGLQNVPDGQVLFTPNHSSNADPLSLILVSDRPIAFLARSITIKTPHVGTVNKAMCGTFLTEDTLEAENEALEAINTTLDRWNDLSYVIFPEGVATDKEFTLNDFNSHIFSVATRKSLPIVPVAIYPSDRLLNQDNGKTVKPIYVSYLKPIYPSDYENNSEEEISNYVKEQIANRLNELKESDQEFVSKLNGFSKKKIEKVLAATTVVEK